MVKFLWILSFTIVAHCNDQFEDEKNLPDAVNMQLQNCFEHVNNRWLVGFTTHLTKVRFKDDCLRECLKAPITHNFTCNSAMYLSSEGECILSQENRKTQPDLFTEPQEGEAVTVHYFENICTLSRMEEFLTNDPGTAVVNFNGYRGVLGYLEFAQRPDDKELISSGIVLGLDAEQLYTVEISKETDWIKGCSLGIKNEFKLAHIKGISQPYVEPVTTLSKEVFQMKSDAHGVHVMARKPLPMSLFGSDRVVGSMLSIWAKGSKSPVACGILKPIKNLPEAMANAATEHHSTAITFLAIAFWLLTRPLGLF